MERHCTIANATAHKELNIFIMPEEYSTFKLTYQASEHHKTIHKPAAH